MSDFLVKHTEGRKQFWTEITNGERFERCNLPYSQCKHGLCQILKRKVLKKVINDNFEPLVFKAIKPESPVFHKKTVTEPFIDGYGMRSSWTFTPYEISDVIKGLEKDMNDRELCIKVCAPRDAVKKLRYKLEAGLIEKLLGKNKERKTKREKVKRKRKEPLKEKLVKVRKNKREHRQLKLE